MGGREFWTWFPVWLGLAVAGGRLLAAMWRDEDDRYALGSHVWRFHDDDDREG
jgi:hypothetical protein